jgi:hypothetical protein
LASVATLIAKVDNIPMSASPKPCSTMETLLALHPCECRGNFYLLTEFAQIHRDDLDPDTGDIWYLVQKNPPENWRDSKIDWSVRFAPTTV